MDTARLYGAIEIIVPLLVFLAFAMHRFRTGMEASWREEAEKYRSKAERQSIELAELHKEVKELRRENAELREQIAELLSR
ncbi:hypothetical protein [Streptomyces uncialis]|uniref:Uncharacterized protein n=1 Tax=Streptomyces uncialis TaxID=1048205 RepID=A0A1Q4UY27_9ACTN|nr:hypothetical protein [Streptomyces uncialis]OKH90471.1 hypothetical protein AB852_35490 [Streptomyces uncialis]